MLVFKVIKELLFYLFNRKRCILIITSHLEISPHD